MIKIETKNDTVMIKDESLRKSTEEVLNYYLSALGVEDLKNNETVTIYAIRESGKLEDHVVAMEIEYIERQIGNVVSINVIDHDKDHNIIYIIDYSNIVDPEIRSIRIE